jgi:hypothetical protein
MSFRYLAIAALFTASSLAEAQAPYSPPRTSGGHPDFQGVWASLSITTVERSKDIPSLIATDEEAKAIVKKFWDATPALEDPDITSSPVRQLSSVRGTLRTSHIVTPADGRFPFTAAGAALSDGGYDSSQGKNDNPEERPVYERCLGGLGHAPMRTLPLLIPTQIVQTPDALTLWTEDVAGFRIVHIGGKPQPSVIRSYDAWSVGRWEGDTLVIETTHFHPRDQWRGDYGRPVVLDENSKVIERLTLISNDELLYQFTVEDSDLYAQPWLAEFSYRRHGGPVYEYACHEANYSIANVLRAGRVAEEKKRSKKK